MTAILPSDFRAPFFRRQRWSRVKNASGSTIAPCSVVLISGSSLSASGEIIYTVRQPNAASTDFNWNGYLVTWPIAIGSSSTAEGLATALTEPGFVRYDSGTPAAKDVWGPKHGQFTLSKNYFGFECLSATTQTAAGNNVMLARWIGVNEVLIYNGTGADISAGHGPDTYNVYGGTAGGESDTGMTLSCYNKSSISFKSTKYGSAGRLNGGQVYAVPWQT